MKLHGETFVMNLKPQNPENPDYPEKQKITVFPYDPMGMPLPQGSLMMTPIVEGNDSDILGGNETEHSVYEPPSSDPITGAPNAHPVATGVGAAGAGLVGTIAGVVLGGPVGGVLGAIAGSVAGGLAGKSAGEAASYDDEESYWRVNHRSEDFGGGNYDGYAPAYHAGYEGFVKYGEKTASFEEVEPQIRADYDQQKPTMPWQEARGASLAAWERSYTRNISAGATDRIDGPGTAGNL
jgi:hypothetical protein